MSTSKVARLSTMFYTFKTRVKQNKDKHKCALNLGSESMLPEESKQSPVFHFVKKLLLITSKHPRTFRYYVSRPSMLAERKRQVVQGGSYIIHPFSAFSLLWNTLMILVNLAHMTIAPLRFFFIIEKFPATLGVLDHTLLALDIICLLDMIVKFNVGYADDKWSSVITLNRQRIAFHYFRSWFLIDLASCLPIAYLLILVKGHRRYLLFAHVSACLRGFRIASCFIDLKIYLKTFTKAYIWPRSVRHITLLLIATHWCCCLIYICPIMYYYWNGHFNPNYGLSLKTYFLGEINQVPLSERYKFALYMSACAIFGTGQSAFKSFSHDEIIMNAIIILFSSVFMVYTMALMFKLYMTKYNSVLRYHELMNQVEKYMRLKMFSVQMMERVRKFYHYKFHERYYKEDQAMACLSEQLRNEIILHSCHRLVDSVRLFDDVPASVVGAILSRLRPEIYMSNDLICRAGERGECIQFISTGTVALYSVKGFELVHLTDGEFFGAPSLLMPDHQYVMSAVAIEITQVYRLEEADFLQYVMTNSLMKERIEELVLRRIHQALLVDKSYRSFSFSADKLSKIRPDPLTSLKSSKTNLQK